MKYMNYTHPRFSRFDKLPAPAATTGGVDRFFTEDVIFTRADNDRYHDNVSIENSRPPTWPQSAHMSTPPDVDSRRRLHGPKNITATLISWWRRPKS
jgi:hypothetical protein